MDDIDEYINYLNNFLKENSIDIRADSSSIFNDEFYLKLLAYITEGNVVIENGKGYAEKIQNLDSIIRYLSNICEIELSHIKSFDIIIGCDELSAKWLIEVFIEIIELVKRGTVEFSERETGLECDDSQPEDHEIKRCLTEVDEESKDREQRFIKAKLKETEKEGLYKKWWRKKEKLNNTNQNLTSICKDSLEIGASTDKVEINKKYNTLTDIRRKSLHNHITTTPEETEDNFDIEMVQRIIQTTVPKEELKALKSNPKIYNEMCNKILETFNDIQKSVETIHNKEKLEMVVKETILKRKIEKENIASKLAIEIIADGRLLKQLFDIECDLYEIELKEKQQKNLEMRLLSKNKIEQIKKILQLKADLTYEAVTHELNIQKKINNKIEDQIFTKNDQVNEYLDNQRTLMNKELKYQKFKRERMKKMKKLKIKTK